jgi:hypothetical protein
VEHDGEATTVICTTIVAETLSFARKGVASRLRRCSSLTR